MQVYETVAYVMRYWFVFVILAILLCVIIVSIAEYRDRKRVMAKAESSIGYMDVVYTSANNLEQGDRFTLEKSNLLGRSASCDIIVNDPDVMKKHVRIEMRDDGVYAEVLAPNNTQLNGQPVKDEEHIFSGDMLLIGSTALMLHLKEEEA